MRNRSFRGYLRTASSAPPVALYKTIEDKPKSITVYGSSGGVGDSVDSVYKIPVILSGINSFNADALNNISGISVSGGNITLTLGNTSYVDVTGQYNNNVLINHLKPNTVYSIKYSFTPVSGTIGSSTARIAILNGTTTKKIFYAFQPSDLGDTVTYFGTFTTPENLSEWSRLIMYGTKNGVSVFSDLRIAEGTYTTNTMPDYEPYIPSKTINLYTPQQLGAGSSISLNGEKVTLSASGTDTDITAIQDMTQDMTIPEANEIRITADTQVMPSRIDIEYYSKEP